MGRLTTTVALALALWAAPPLSRKSGVLAGASTIEIALRLAALAETGESAAASASASHQRRWHRGRRSIGGLSFVAAVAFSPRRRKSVQTPQN